MTMEAKNILFKTIFILCIVPENVIVYITTLNLTFSVTTSNVVLRL